MKYLQWIRRFFRAQQAYREAVNLAQCLARKHYPDGSPEWRVCDDTTGVIFQISNMTSGMARVKPTTKTT